LPLTAEQRQRGPSTPEERQHAVAVVRALEKEALAESAPGARQELLIWMAEVPDISVSFCPDELLGGKLAMKGKKDKSDELASALSFQLALGSLVFLIEHPDQAGDQAAVALAGVESTLRTYQNLISARPEARFPRLDELLEIEKAGGLPALMAKRAKQCA